MTTEEYINKEKISEAELFSLTQEQMEEVRDEMNSKRRSVTQETRRKMSTAAKKRWTKEARAALAKIVHSY